MFYYLIDVEKKIIVREKKILNAKKLILCIREKIDKFVLEKYFYIKVFPSKKFIL